MYKVNERGKSQQRHAVSLESGASDRDEVTDSRRRIFTPSIPYPHPAVVARGVGHCWTCRLAAGPDTRCDREEGTGASKSNLGLIRARTQQSIARKEVSSVAEENRGCFSLHVKLLLKLVSACIKYQRPLLSLEGLHLG